VAKTDGTGVNMRARPTASALAVAILMEGTTVDVIGEDVQAEGRTWRNVRTIGSTTDGVSGWVVTQYLVP
jgi:SH3-like domain-containing protein